MNDFFSDLTFVLGISLIRYFSLLKPFELDWYIILTGELMKGERDEIRRKSAIR
jgi:hypothetical protein